MCMHAQSEEGRPKGVRRRMPRAAVSFDGAVEHIGGITNWFSTEGMDALKDAAQDYIWKYPNRDGGNAYCTACGTTFEPERYDLWPRHNGEMACPACGKTVVFKRVGLGHKNVYDRFVFYEWRTSRIDDETLVLTAALVWRDSTGKNPEDARLEICRNAIYVFRSGCKTTVYKTSCDKAGAVDPDRFNEIENVTDAHAKYGHMGSKCEICVVGEENIAGTRMAKTMDLIAARGNNAMAVNWTLRPTAWLDRLARWPWLEYLAKSGQAVLAQEIMEYGAGNRFNTRAKRPKDLLRLSDAEWAEIKQKKIELTRDMLDAAELMREMGLNDGMEAVKNRSAYSVRRLRDGVSKPLTEAGVGDKARRKILRRILRTPEEIGEWCDYYEQLQRLGEDLRDSALNCPKDMHAMHRRKTEQWHAVMEAEREKRRAQDALIESEGWTLFKKRILPELRKRFRFEARGLLLRPFEDAEEIMAEGKTQRICIGMYATRQMRGDTIICCLRKANEPDEPWRAVEFSAQTGHLVQDRGYANDYKGGKMEIDENTKKLLKLFWADFEEWRKDRKWEKLPDLMPKSSATAA